MSAVALVSCRKEQAEGAPDPVEVQPEVNRTFDPDQVVEQIDHTIATSKKTLATSRSAYARRNARRQLLGALLQRASFLGDLSAYDEAVAQADAMVADRTETAARHIQHARVLSALHRFAGAAAALDRAEAEGASPASLELPRIRLLLSQGKPRQALERLEALEKRDASLSVISTLAVTLSDLGRHAAAERQFSRAVSAPTLLDPLPVAYLWFQQGLMWEREGQRGKARDYYQKALERFPYYPALASHLAALEAEAGDTESAIRRLRELSERTDDPEYLGQLSKLLGDTAEAATLAARAEAAYAELLKKYPEAFADHAARFYLDVVKKPARALELAAANLENRPTDEAYQLYLDAAHAAGKTADPATCAVASRAAARDHATAYALFTAARALRACGEEAGADAAMNRAKKAARQR